MSKAHNTDLIVKEKEEAISNKIIRHLSNFFDHNQIVKAAKISLTSKTLEEKTVDENVSPNSHQRNR